MFAFLTVLLVAIYTADGLTCLKCEGVISPRHCHAIENCGENMACLVEKYRDEYNEVLYNVRCGSETHCSSGLNATKLGKRLHQERANHSPLVTCSECCHSDLCNAAGCGEIGFPTQRGPVCLQCPQSRVTSACHSIAVCDVDEVNIILVWKFSSNSDKTGNKSGCCSGRKCQIDVQVEFGEEFYSTSCVYQQICDGHAPGSIFGKRSNIKSICRQCCDSDLCNDKCENFNISLPTETTGSRATSSETTPATITLPTTITTTSQPSITKGQEGKDFWFTFPQNIVIDSYLNLYIYITSNSDKVVSVHVLNNTGSTTYTFTNSLVIQINRTIQLLPNLIEAKGIRITANDTIAVTGYSDYDQRFSDAFNVIPARELGTSYVVASYHLYASNYPPFVSVLPIFSDTTVRITLNTTKTYSYNGHSYSSGNSFEIYLKQYNAFQLSHTADLTGTIVNSDKPVAVQSGVSDAIFPGYADTYYSVFLPPISRLGSTFIVPSFTSSNKTSVRVIPLDNSSTLVVQNFNGSKSYRLSKTIELDVPESHATVLMCSKPCLVATYSYFKVPQCQFMSLVPAVSQYSYNYTYITPHHGNQYSHYLSIMVKSSDVGELLINGKTIFSLPLTTDAVSVNNTGWSVLSVKLGRGTYSISSTIMGSKYGVIAYGLRSSGSYAYPLSL